MSWSIKPWMKQDTEESASDLMKTTIVIPTCWRGPVSEAPICTLESDYLYDHASPLDSEGTLGRALSSLSILKSDSEFAVAVVAAYTRPEIKQAVQLRVRAIMAQYDYDYPIMLIDADKLTLWRRRLAAAGHSRFDDLLNLEGYSNIRNMGLLAAVLTGADVAVLFDDHQIYEDPQYLAKALEFIGNEHEGEFVGGIAGCYRYNGGSYLMPEAHMKWQHLWGDVDSMNSMMKVVAGQPRLQKTTFAFGGNMVIHRTLFEKVPFDPAIPRGEDTDYLINARFFGHDFFRDRDLRINMTPSPRCAPSWYQLRKDITRFSLERAKLATQGNGGREHLTAADFDPFPGRFLKDDLHDLVLQASLELAMEYFRTGRDADAQECMSNIAISKVESRSHGDPFGDYMEYQRRWQEFISIVPELNIWSPVIPVD